jgi:peptidoglycan-associated lipoprotein
MFRKFVLLAVMGAFSFTMASCAKKQVVKQEIAPEEFKSDAEEPGIRGKEFQKTADIKVINFQYDSAELEADAREILKANSEYLKKNSKLDVLVEGHCDERGSLEYNMVLGQRRATSTRQYYIKLGVSSSRISTISYGEERPVDPGQTEAAWAKNRRAETLVRNKLEISK